MNPKKKKRYEISEVEALQKEGLSLGGTQDQFSYQPDSGSGIDGVRGRQEHGIKAELDAEGFHAQRELDNEELEEDPLSPVPGESQWSQEHRLPNDASNYLEKKFRKER